MDEITKLAIGAGVGLVALVGIAWAASGTATAATTTATTAGGGGGTTTPTVTPTTSTATSTSNSATLFPNGPTNEGTVNNVPANLANGTPSTAEQNIAAQTAAGGTTNFGD